MKKEQYKNIFKAMLLVSGRKKKWVHEQIGLSRIDFYRKVHNDKLTERQKETIKKLLSK